MRARTRIVDILRDFAAVHRLTHELAERHRAGELRFAALTELVGETESSALFRLKERSHAIFREPARSGRRPTHREALFDLAVGSLYHEAMKLRENLYQREVYGPRVRALRSGAGLESKALFDEFEKMLGALGSQLDEGIREVELLTQRTADQLRLLVAESADEGAARFLTEQEAEVERLFGVGLDVILEEAFGSVAEGLERAGRSYLASGSFEAAADRIGRAMERSTSGRELSRLRSFALGMRAYVVRDYAESLRHLQGWFEGDSPDADQLPLARDAVASIAQLADSGSDTQRGAAELLNQLGELSAAAAER